MNNYPAQNSNNPLPQPPMGQGLPPQGAPPPHREQGAQAYPGYGPPPGYQAPPTPYGQAQPYGAQPYYPPRKPNSGKSIASLVCGVVSVFMWPFAVLAGPAGIVLGIMGLKETRPDGPKGGRGFAIGGLITSAIMLVVALGVGAIIGGAAYYGAKQTEEHRQQRTRADLELISTRLVQYAQENNGSLGPGGPVLSNSSPYYATPQGNGAVAVRRVTGTLALSDLVTDFELGGTLYDYDLQITGTTTATVTARNGKGRAEVTDASTGSRNVNVWD